MLPSALTPDSQVALTLREVCGLTTEDAHAFLTSPSTVAQRIVRAKAKIRDARIPYRVPARADIPARLDTVLHVVYLVFNEDASAGESLTRHDLSAEALRLGRLLVELLPEAEVIGLLALMLLHESRRAARTTESGELVLLDEQDRTRWNRDQIAEGCALVERALTGRRFGPYAAGGDRRGPCRGQDLGGDDWGQIVGLYDVLLRADPSPVVELNRAAAIAMRDGPAAGLVEVDEILARGDLGTITWRTRRELICAAVSVGLADARASYERALVLDKNPNGDSWRRDYASCRSTDLLRRRQQ